jgi:hypothetical protein
MFKLFLLFFLLRTSVVALPLHKEEHHNRVHLPPMLIPGLLESLPPELRLFYRIPKEVRNHANQRSMSNPLQGMDAEFIDDIFEIHHPDGHITFPDVLTEYNLERILGDWRPIPSVSCLPQFYN